ncbi:MAG: hypothetical protein WAL25_00215, partial [Acidimicrobiia bacterium]
MELQDRPPPVGHRWPWPVWLVFIGLIAAAVALWLVRLDLGGTPGPIVAGVFVDGPMEVNVVVLYVVTMAALLTISTALISREPSNSIGWALWAIAAWTVVTFFITMLLFAVGEDGSRVWDVANWLGAWTFTLSVPTCLVLMIFPTGHWLSPKWRVFGLAGALGTLGWAMTEASNPGLGLSREIPNPFAHEGWFRIGAVMGFLLIPALIATVYSLVYRFRRSGSIQRLQVKWVLLGGLFQVGVIILTWLADSFSPSDFPLQAVMVGLLSTLFVPLSLMIAILRYRLYSIDHLISRTAAYAVLAFMLAAVYFLGVVGAQAVLDLSNALAVAITTLALALAFNPVRLRLQGAMDRRFNRSRFDADAEAVEFAGRVNATVSLADLVTDLE